MHPHKHIHTDKYKQAHPHTRAANPGQECRAINHVGQLTPHACSILRGAVHRHTHTRSHCIQCPYNITVYGILCHLTRYVLWLQDVFLFFFNTQHIIAWFSWVSSLFIVKMCLKSPQLIKAPWFRTILVDNWLARMCYPCKNECS